MTDLYDRRFFDSIRDGCQRSASALVPILVEYFKPSAVVDVGCGEGLWGRAFQDAGSEVLGLDGCESPVIPARRVELGERLPEFERTFDLAVCLEVAEHLPPERAESFIADLCRISETVVFSAAVPGQGGTGHRNEQWPQYWVDLFASHGFACSDDLRWEIWGDERICWWYRQNLIVATAGRFAKPNKVPAVVHPAAWAHHGHR